MVTIKEIAKECSVSATTVSNILNGKPKVSEETKQRVMDTIKRMGYQPNYIAQGLRRQKTQTIGIIAEDIAQFTTPGIIESVMSCCEKAGYRTIVQNLRLYARWSEEWYNNNEEYHSVFDAALQEAVSIKVDGLIYIAGHARIIHTFPPEFRIPAVMAYAYTRTPGIPSVVMDDEKGAYDMVNYMTGMGHKRIGVVAGRADNIHTQKRLLGYQKALYEAKIPYDPDMVYYGDWQRQSGYIGSGKLIERGASAIFCMADRVAGGVYDYLEEKGMKAGQDISVTGYDDQDISEYFRPGLTTAELPLSEIGRKSAQLLLDMLSDDSGRKAENADGPDEIKEIVIPCRIIIRESVGKIKDQYDHM